MNARKVCILGGTGFVGRHITAKLHTAGWQVTIPTRRPQRHRELLTNHQATLIEADIRKPEVLRALFNDCSAVINLVGILNERRAGDFRALHVELPRMVVQACQATGVKRLLHMSALNAYPREEHSQYLRTKGEGEDLVHAASAQGLQVTSFRPSVIFGPDDSFFNRFAGLLRLPAPFFPLACPEAKFAPVYVGDVAQAFVVALDNKATIGQHIDLCGPRTYSLGDLVRYTAEQIGCQRRIVHLGRGASQLQARLLELVPGKPFSRDNFWSLQKDSVCAGAFPYVIGIEPTAVEAVVPRYLGQRNTCDRNQRFRNLARRG